MTEQDHLDPPAVTATVSRLEARIAARFPERRLRLVAHRLVDLADEVAQSTSDARWRVRAVRAGSRVTAGLVVAGTVLVVVVAYRDASRGALQHAVDWVPLIESTVNDVVFAAIAVFFLLALPQRIVRGRLLGLLHRLRSLAHIVDMHQLTKDPERLRPDFVTTPESVETDLDRAGMEHYLEYCSELLSLIGKVAALCAEESQDSVVLGTVSDLETLTTGMSRKIWQKISLLPD